LLGLVLSVIDKNILKMGTCFAILMGFSAWGHVVIHPVYYRQGRVLEGLVWGTISGIAIGSLITSVIVLYQRWNLLIILEV
jgi:hypothetical protein